MGRPYTGNISTRTYERVQKNGDIYVYEEQKQYDRERKMTITIGTHLLGKKLKGTDEIVPTRPKRKSIKTGKEAETPGEGSLSDSISE